MLQLRLLLVALAATACSPTFHVKVYKVTATAQEPQVTGYGFAMRRRGHHMPRVYAVMGVPYNNIVATTECDH